MMYKRASIAALTIGLALVLAGCGQSTHSSTAAPGRTVDVNMTDNAFAPNNLQVTKGETITFRFHNNGAAVHEAVIGDDAFQAEHHQQMTNGSTMGSTLTTVAMGHGGMNAGTPADEETVVQTGQMAEMRHTFTDSGNVLIGCHQPGHWEAGMKATVKVQ